MNCAFCEIIEGKKPREIIGETENIITILSDPFLMKGHCLVIPKKHVEKLSELSQEEVNELMKEVINVKEILLKKFSGCDIRQNFRPFQKQDGLKVNHLHIHLQPREFEDELYEKCQIYEKSIFRNSNEGELKQTKQEVFN